MINAPSRTFRARVELLDGSTILDTFDFKGALKEFDISKAGDNNKFFGYGICQKLEMKLLDKDRQITSIEKGLGLEVVVGVGCEYLYPYPIFFVDEITRDENTNELTVIAYDKINDAANHKVSELSVHKQFYNIEAFAASCAELLGVPLKFIGVDNFAALDGFYYGGANFDGSETVREALNAIAEATQTVYFINHDWELTFKRLDIAGEPVLTIDKSKYFTLSRKTPKYLGKIVSTTELEDNLFVDTMYAATGSTQYIRSNPFWETNTNIMNMMTAAAQSVDGLVINQFDCSWRGNFLLEIGDKIAMISKDNETFTSYVLNDTITYNGGLKEQTNWIYSESQEDEAKPATIAEAIRATYTKVDRANKRIELVAEQTSKMMIEADRITASVSKMDEDFKKMSSKVDASVTAEDVNIQISKYVNDGKVDKVTTTTGFTFDEEGLTVSKSDRDMETTISEDGMVVKRQSEEMLVANHIGVTATNLHARTYLIIGLHSHFQDYGSDRTGCFWE
jgi:hypothetical protein